MKQRIIGFDIDGVLTYEEAGGKNIWQKELERYFGGITRQQPSFSFCEAYGLTLAQVEKFMEEKAVDIFWQVPVQPGCRETLKQLQKLDFTIYLITARDPEYRTVTRQWLKKNKLPYTALWFEKNKGRLCKELGIELFVDDYWENCTEIGQYGVQVLLMTAHHNEGHPIPPSVRRVANWNDIKREIARFYDLPVAALYPSSRW